MISLGKRLWNVVLPLMALVICWALLSALLTESLLPGPWRTLVTLAEDLRHGEIWLHLGATMRRVAYSFVLAMVLGTVIGVSMGLSRSLDTLANPLLIVGLNIPMLVVSVILYIALGLNEWAAVLAVALNKIPIVTVMLREGTRALDPKYFELVHAFRVPSRFALRDVILPQLYPYLMASARTGLALIWKIVLVVEFLGRSDGIGFQIHLFFQDYNMAQILSYTLLLVCLMLAIDYLIMQPLDRGAFKSSERHGRGH